MLRHSAPATRQWRLLRRRELADLRCSATALGTVAAPSPTPREVHPPLAAACWLLASSAGPWMQWPLVPVCSPQVWA